MSLVKKTYILGIRVTPAEHRAVKRFAKAQSQTIADLIRGRVVNPAIAHDPKQTELFVAEQAPVTGTAAQRWAYVRRECARLEREEKEKGGPKIVL